MNAETNEHFTISSSKENQRLKSFLRERERGNKKEVRGAEAQEKK